MAAIVSLKQVQNLASEYLITNDFEAFAKKFSALFYDIEETGSPVAIQLAYRIESKLADVSAGLSSVESLRNFLAGIAVPANTNVIQAQSFSLPVMIEPNPSPAISVYSYPLSNVLVGAAVCWRLEWMV